MMRLVVLFSAVFMSAQSQWTSVSQCTSSPGDLPLITYIEGCSAPPCVLHQQAHTAIHTIFKAPHNIASMRTLATAFLRVGAITLPIQYDLQEQADTCNFLTNGQCPMSQGAIAEYILRFYIEPFFPVGTSVTLELRVVDQDNEPVFCLRVPITIASPRAALAAEQ